METKEELLTRLANAQEFLKAQSAVGENDINQAMFGGEQGIGMGDPNSMIAQQGMNLANGALDGAINAFGKTGIDTSGSQVYDKQKVDWLGAGKNLLSGDIGAGFKLVGDIIGTGKANKDIAQANTNNALKVNSQYSSNFAGGGFMDDIFKVTDEASDKLNDVGQTDIFNPISKPTYGGATPDVEQSGLDKRWNWLKEGVNENYGDALRYAPAAMNAYQLSQLEKPEFESLDRLGNRYEKDLVDESALRNSVQQEADNTRNAVTNASAGSAGALRSNLLGVQANSNKALSNAMLQAENINRGENQAEQQFNLGVDSTNLQQSNVENDINARNKAAYDTSKSQYLAQIGNDIGNIGKEEKYKQMIKDMGVCYDSRGAYICGTEERVPEGIDTKSTNENAQGGEMNSNSLFSSYLEQLLAKKK
ncbi:structural protein [Cellulophaga phage phi14:2]|uniref:Structural protein n=1 Tax=Cellulophaga phage phi14:2 TaxID=1327990 RepID=S0A401_9CAUD|nr:structural protein [Cellulophaga phage phi14:2]AGO48958.1 structural protein [Cellulophaga phage phi14:2]